MEAILTANVTPVRHRIVLRKRLLLLFSTGGALGKQLEGSIGKCKVRLSCSFFFCAIIRLLIELNLKRNRTIAFVKHTRKDKVLNLGPGAS